MSIYETKMDPSIIKIAKSKEAILAIRQDDCPESPRDWDNLGAMLCFHGKYSLGDADHGYDSDDYSGWDEMEKAIRENEDVAIILPLYLYDHSGITISTSPFSSGWDSGQIGFIYMTNKKAKECWPVEFLIGEHIKIAREALIAEVETYDQYLRGDIYGFLVETPDGEHIDSCSGFYGTEWKENGMADHLGEYAYLLKELEDA